MRCIWRWIRLVRGRLYIIAGGVLLVVSHHLKSRNGTYLDSQLPPRDHWGRLRFTATRVVKDGIRFVLLCLLIRALRRRPGMGGGAVSEDDLVSYVGVFIVWQLGRAGIVQVYKRARSKAPRRT